MMRPQESVSDSAATDADWRLWCRLCAKQDPQNNINILFKEEHLGSGIPSSIPSSNDLNLVDAVRKYYRVNITSVDELPKRLCTECFSRVTSMINFSERVCKVQQMFWALQNSTENTKLHLQSLRLKYGVLDEDSEHVIQCQLPEVHYVEEKLIIGEFEQNIFEVQTTAKNPLEPTRISIKIKKNNLLSKENVHTDLECDPDSVIDDVVGEISAQSKMERTTRKRKQRIREPQEEKPAMSSRKRQCQAKIKPTKRNDNMINLEDETQSESDEQNIFEAKTNGKNRLEPTRISIKVKRNNLLCKKNSDNDYDVDDKDFEYDPDSVIGDIDCNISAQSKFEGTTRKRKQRIREQQEEKPSMSSRKRQCQAKIKPTKRNDTTLHKGSEHTKDSKDDTIINLEDETQSESDCNDDEDFVPPNYIKEKEKETHVTHSQPEVKVKKVKSPAVCDVCKKIFPNHSKLRRHLEVHDSNKHTCPECGLQLNTRATFRDHMLVHSDEMKYKCDFCGRPFKRRNTMMMHRRLHSGLRPYLCEFCGRTFPTSVNCRTHKTLAHRKELAAIEASSECRTMQNVVNEYTQVENSQIST